MGGALAGASILELAYHRAAWARAAADSGSQLVDIKEVAAGIYFAQARPQAMINCNSSIFVGAKDVVVVDQEAPVIVGLQPVVEVNLVQIGSHKLLAQFVSFRA